MTQLPIASVSRLYERAPQPPRDGLTLTNLHDLVEVLARADVASPGVASLLAGRPLVEQIERPLLLVLEDPRLDAIAQWAATLSAASYASMLALTCTDLDAPSSIGRRDAGLLLGHGVVLASRGVSGRPLVGMALEELRGELVDSRRRLSELAGYPVHALAPEPNTFGNAVDGLVLEQARRAGYRLVLRPGRAISQTSDATDAQLIEYTYRRIRTDDSAEHLRDWALGKGLARGVAQVRDLVNRPRRILSKFGIE